MKLILWPLDPNNESKYTIFNNQGLELQCYKCFYLDMDVPISIPYG